jgi:hypothetical protein
VCNLRTLVGETSGCGVADHVAARNRHGIRPNLVRYDPATMAGAESVPGAIAATLSADGAATHDPELLGDALEAVFVSA